jgi:Fic family protein
MALGEAASKCQHIAGVPLAPEVADKMHHLYLIKGAVATTAIEGNTLSEDEAERIISGTLKLPPSQQYLADELNNIVAALDVLTLRIAQSTKAGDHHITPALLKEMNRMVLRDLEVEKDVVPGEIRKHSVVVGRYRCAPAEDCDYLLEKFCEVLNEFPCPQDGKSQFCIVKAIFAHLYFVWIHPFGDGNGRTARLLELYILLAAGFPQPTGHLLSNHYNRTRPRYYERLDAAVKGADEVVAFIRYSVEGLVDGLREQIEFIRRQQWHVAWLNFVHDHFHNQNSASDVRRRHVVLALSAVPDGVGVSKIQNLTPELVREYFGKTSKTLARDLNWLLEADLITKDRKGVVRANREKILAFLAWRAPEEQAAALRWPLEAA